MLIDLEGRAAGQSFASEVCVLGAGIAGLVLAHRLGGLGVKVDLLEGGGLELEQRSQALYEVERSGGWHTGATEGRFRVFGGSSTRWGGQLLPYTNEIFRPGEGIPSTAWPIGAAAIERYYGDVLKVMGADGLPFGAELLESLGHAAVPFGSDVQLRFSKWAPFGRRNLAKGLGRACIAHESVTVFTHANAVRLEETGGRVMSVVVKNYAGAEFRFEAEHFVVCMGTIESSRLLLASGVGNGHDQAGRYFHDHVSVRVAAIEGAARAKVLERLGPFVADGTMHTCKLEATAALRAREGLPAVMGHVVIEEPADSGAAAVRGMLRSLQRGEVRKALSTNLLPMVRGVWDVVRLVWESKVRGRRAVSARAKVWLHIDQEQVAGAEDRIRLAETRDAMGQRKADVEWRVGARERDAARRFAEVLRRELEGVGVAGLTWLQDGVMTDTYHPMGGLRMGVDPRESVVDTELKVHGVRNLHVASCAVFPSGGSSNPTFTMMALTLRLADRLATVFGAKHP